MATKAKDSSDETEETLISWEADGKRGQKTTITKWLTRATPIYSREGGVRSAVIRMIVTACNSLSSDPSKRPDAPIFFTDPLDHFEPALDPGDAHTLRIALWNKAYELARQTCAKVDRKDPKVSDLLFIGKLGLERKWRSECAICLWSEMEGAKWRETIVFRPCGHSVCLTPCYRDLAKMHGVELTPETGVDEDGRTFEFVMHDESVPIANLRCHLCRSPVTSRVRPSRLQWIDHTAFPATSIDPITAFGVSFPVPV